MSVVEASRARHAVVHRLTVSAIDHLTEDAIAIAFHVPEELRDAYTFMQGQHVALAVPGSGDTLRRSYSICTPAGSGELKVAVKLIPGGEFSSWAHNGLRPGDELEVLTPTGGFRTELDPANEKNYAGVAAGSGITPIISILATTLAVEPRSTFTLLYGNRTVASTMFLEELLDLKNEHTNRFAFHPVLSRETQDAPLLSGRIDGGKLEAFLDSPLAGRDYDEWFLCGPLEMVQSLRETLIARGVDSHRIHRELFHAGPAAATGAIAATTLGTQSTVTIVLDGRSTQFQLAANGKTILDAALLARPDAPYACKGGVCGTCRCRVTAGEVRMVGGYALEPDEIDAGFVLACQSHPVTPEVTLDFDA